MEKTTGNNAATTMAHELVARDENAVATFFCAFAIQFYLQKEMLAAKLNPPLFITNYSDIEIFASQRVLIKSLLVNPKYNKIVEDLKFLFLESNDHASRKTPQDLFLSRINKAFLIRQIFKHTDQVLEKFAFLDKFFTEENSSIDLDELNKKIWHLPNEQQILILVRAFAHTKDSFENKKKTILSSFGENIMRVQEDIKKNQGRYTPAEISSTVNMAKFVMKLQNGTN